ncbi:hypothetical protein KC992_01680 [Candidatus Saccharibacteria bacterium]|nr:hypothetical protein [Candidatus Saccharibacteria bacterium]
MSDLLIPKPDLLAVFSNGFEDFRRVPGIDADVMGDPAMLILAETESGSDYLFNPTGLSKFGSPEGSAILWLARKNSRGQMSEDLAYLLGTPVLTHKLSVFSFPGLGVMLTNPVVGLRLKELSR